MTTALQQYPPFEQDYQRLNLLGEGSFGKVYLGERIPAETQIQSENADCSNKSSQGSSGLAKEKAREYFALKKLKPYLRKKHHSPPVVHIEEFPEVQLMRRLDHPNLLQLRGIVQFDKGYELNHYLVMDFGIQLLEFGKHKEVSLSREVTRCLVRQLVEAVIYLHAQGVMHRDIKPDNIYLMKDGTLKLGDFSISAPVAPASPHTQMVEETEEHIPQQHTSNVTTRQYRAPEIIYGSRSYDESIDIWSLGCTVVELILGQTLFPGTTDIHQLELIFSILGCPQDQWPEASELPYYLEFDNSKQPTGLKHLVPDCSPELLDFLERTLQLNPLKRLKAVEMMKHPYLQGETPSARQQLGKISGYLHEKKLREILKSKK